ALAARGSAIVHPIVAGPDELHRRQARRHAGIARGLIALRRRTPVGAPQGEPAVRSSLRSANAAAPASNSPAPPSTAVESTLNERKGQPASPHIASQRGHFRSRAVSVSAQAFAIA